MSERDVVDLIALYSAGRAESLVEMIEREAVEPPRDIYRDRMGYDEHDVEPD